MMKLKAHLDVSPGFLDTPLKLCHQLEPIHPHPVDPFHSYPSTLHDLMTYISVATM